MKRPLVVLTLGFALAALYHTYQFSFLNHGGILFCFLVLLAVCFLNKQYRMISAYLIAGVFMGTLYANAYDHLFVSPVQELAGDTCEVTGIVQEYPSIYNDSQRIKLKIYGTNNKPFYSLVYLPITDTAITPGDRIQMTVSFYLPQIYDGFDKATYYRANAIYILGSISDGDSVIIKKANRIPLRFFPQMAAKCLKENIQQIFLEREGAFLRALLLGDKSGLEALDAVKIRKAGLSHAVAVSGMHIGFLVSFCTIIFGKKFGTGFALLLILVYVPMAGCSPSAVRAGIMYSIGCIGFIFAKQTDTLQSLCIALLALLIQNPFAIQGIGLQLSFASTLGLLLFSVKFQQFLMSLFEFPKSGILNKLLRMIITGLSCSICALLFTIPIIMLSFGYITVLAPLTNVLALPAISFAFVLGLCTSVCYSFLPVLAHVLKWLCIPILRYLFWILDTTVNFPYGMIYENNVWGITALLLIYLIFFAGLLTRYKQRLIYVLQVVLGSLLIIIMLVGIQQDSCMVRFSALPCGYGQAVLVTQGREDVTLIDCSGSGYRNGAKSVQECLLWNGFDHIDRIIITSLDITHARNIPELLEKVPVSEIIIPSENKETDLFTRIESCARHKGIPIIHASQNPQNSQITITESIQNICLIGSIPQKLGVEISLNESKIFIAHCLTAKMLNKILQTYVPQCDILVLSENNLQNYELIQDSVYRIKPQQILLNAGYNTTDRLFRVPVRNTLLEGEIQYGEVRKHAKIGS